MDQGSPLQAGPHQKTDPIPLKPEALHMEGSKLEGEPYDPGSVQNVPLEVLGDTFAILLSQQPNKCDMGRQTLLNLCLVCRRWRHAALIKHPLWAAVRLGRDQMGSYGKVSNWLGRAGSYPKTLEVFHDVYESTEGEEEEEGQCPGESRCTFRHPTFLRLLSNGPTLGGLGLFGINTSCFRHLLGHFDAFQYPANLPWQSVRALELHFSPYGMWPLEQDDDPARSIFFPLSPVHSLALSLPWSSEAIPWNRSFALNIPSAVLRGLTSFAIQSSWELEHILPVLQQCFHLVELEFNAEHAWLEYSQDAPAYRRLLDSGGVRLPALRILRMRNSHPSMTVLDFLTTPTLEKLDLSFYIDQIYCDDMDDVEQLAMSAEQLTKPLFPFLQRSSCPLSLRFLRLHNRTLGSAELVYVFFKLSGLAHVILDDVVTNYADLWGTLASPQRVSFLDIDTTLFLLGLRHLELLNINPFTVGEMKNLARYLHSPNRTDPVHVTLPLSPDEESCQSEETRSRAKLLRNKNISVDVMARRRRGEGLKLKRERDFEFP